MRAGAVKTTKQEQEQTKITFECRDGWDHFEESYRVDGGARVIARLAELYRTGDAGHDRECLVTFWALRKIAGCYKGSRDY